MEAPRWRLVEPHYLNVPFHPDGTPTEWEHNETSRETGRAVRKRYTVPLMLDPKDPADFNYKETGEIIVTLDVEGATVNRRDMIFVGEPTPGMEPLNEAAEEITNQLKVKWAHPVDTLPAQGGMNSAEQAFMQQMMEAFTKQMQATPLAGNAVVSKEAYDALKVQAEEQKARLDRLEALIAKQGNPPAPDAVRRL